MNGTGYFKITDPLPELKRGKHFTVHMFQGGVRTRVSGRCASVYRRNGVTHIRFDDAIQMG